MLYAVTKDGQKVRPNKDVIGYCPICQEKVIAKMGDIRVNHWSHQKNKDCDNWSEGETDWHLFWKSIVKKANTEVVIGEHRADIVNSKGTVIELQHSSISTEEIAERESFYGDMIWLFDLTHKRKNFIIVDKFYKENQGRHCMYHWKWGWKKLYSVQKPIFVDIGKFSILHLTEFGLPYGYANLYTYKKFIELYMGNIIV